MKTRIFALLVLGTACSTGEPADSGTDARLSVRGGSFVREALPDPSGGPDVEAAYLGQESFPVGFQDKSFSGVLGPTATAIVIALDGDDGYWVVPAGPPLVETPDRPSFDAPLSFSREAAAGPQLLLLSAVDADERFGPRKQVPFTLTSGPVPEGSLVFSLYWDRPSDLDLHVVLPDGTEVYKDEMNSWEPTPGETDPDAFRQGGQLDFDSNAECRNDGRNNENVVWSVEPPVGLYLVRVDTFSLCGEPAARWRAEARYHGQLVAASSGTSLPSDTRFAHGAGAGVVAFELSVH